MASVTSLDKDMKNIRLSKYTPKAANETRAWIEDALGENLKPGDLLEALKDGTALCKLVNMATSPGVRFKESLMPFVQMENISHFLRACQSPPLNLQSHDIFQTVDLYEAKDPAQVLQCISAFSRKAHAIQPMKFHNVLGEKIRSGTVSPQSTGGYSAAGPKYGRPRNSSNLSETTSIASSQPSQAIGGRGSPFRPSVTSTAAHDSKSSSGVVSSWSKKDDEGSTTPAWNIHQYGYMGGASQGNQGITFGGRRQITTPAPKVPSLAEKERKRRDQEAELERQRTEAEEAESQRRRRQDAEEEKARIAEAERWEEEAKRRREEEKTRHEEEKRRWEEEEKRWKEEEEMRAREERDAEERFASERKQRQLASDVHLQGQFLSQYQAERKENNVQDTEKAAERKRIEELERQLEEAKAREAQYERERQERSQADQNRDRSRSRANDRLNQRDQSRSKSRTRSAPVLEVNDPWQEDERDYLRQQWERNRGQPSESRPPPQPSRPLPVPQATKPAPPSVEAQEPEPIPPPQPPRPLPVPQEQRTQSQYKQIQLSELPPPPQPPRPLPNPQAAKQPSPLPPQDPSPTPPPSQLSSSPIPSRPLPNPATYNRAPQTSPQRKSPFTRPQPATASPSSSPSSPSSASQINPSPSQLSTSTPKHTSPLKKPPFANPSSLLSREMELDRQRQQEWEEAQKATKATAAGAVNSEEGIKAIPGGGAWDVNQYGYLGGDSQNKGATGIGFGSGGRRQLVGPRDPPGKAGGI